MPQSRWGFRPQNFMKNLRAVTHSLTLGAPIGALTVREALPSIGFSTLLGWAFRLRNFKKHLRAVTHSLTLGAPIGALTVREGLPSLGFSTQFHGISRGLQRRRPMADNIHCEVYSPCREHCCRLWVSR
jgi:hypothetical protein